MRSDAILLGKSTFPPQYGLFGERLHIVAEFTALHCTNVFTELKEQRTKALLVPSQVQADLPTAGEPTWRIDESITTTRIVYVISSE
ncbi:hypothetical protein J6590_052662 [Homalodisca vitripennis]|nr:hypothetical protein J6590_052662 [Homalodisca vitripennis]